MLPVVHVAGIKGARQLGARLAVQVPAVVLGCRGPVVWGSAGQLGLPLAVSRLGPQRTRPTTMHHYNNAPRLQTTPSTRPAGC